MATTLSMGLSLFRREEANSARPSPKTNAVGALFEFNCVTGGVGHGEGMLAFGGVIGPVGRAAGGGAEGHSGSEGESEGGELSRMSLGA